MSDKAKDLFERLIAGGPETRGLCRAELLALPPEDVVRGAQAVGNLAAQTHLWALLQCGPARRWLPALLLLAKEQRAEFDALARLVAERLAECVTMRTGA